MQFLAIEHTLPNAEVTNEERIEAAILESEAHLSHQELQVLRERLVKRLSLAGSHLRYVRQTDETALSIGIRAGELAIEKSRLDRSEIDLLIYVGVGRGFLEPATANVFHEALRLTNATCFDLLDACASWLRAVDIAHSFLATRKYKNIMILNCECNREYGDLAFHSLEDIDFKFPNLTIGEAATATIVTASKADDSYYASFKTWGVLHNLCKIPLPHYREFSTGSDSQNLRPLRFYSYGEQLFRTVFKRLVEHYQRDDQINTFTPDIVFGHSASDGLSEKIAHVLKLKNVYLSHARFGNTVSASIPLGMSYALKEGRLKPGMAVTIGCGSAGVTTGWCRFRLLD